MFIKQIMTHNPVTIRPETTVPEAQAVLKREKIHHLPVVDRNDKLVGIVTEKDLLYASPSPATTLNVYEMNDLLSKLKIEKVMTKNVITIGEDTLVEDAAHIMVDRNIGGLPIMRGGVLAGIVTESDIFRLFIELFGTRRKGLRATALVSEKPGLLAKITSAIAERGGNIISLGTFPGENIESSLLLIKTEEISKEKLEESIVPYVKELLDLREV